MKKGIAKITPITAPKIGDKKVVKGQKIAEEMSVFGGPISKASRISPAPHRLYAESRVIKKVKLPERWSKEERVQEVGDQREKLLILSSEREVA